MPWHVGVRGEPRAGRDQPPIVEKGMGRGRAGIRKKKESLTLSEIDRAPVNLDPPSPQSLYTIEIN
jgi:hypothetical protein